jgi:hypothetical protein
MSQPIVVFVTATGTRPVAQQIPQRRRRH